MERKHQEEGSASWAKDSSGTEARGLEMGMCEEDLLTPSTENGPSVAGAGNLLLLFIMLNFYCHSSVSFFKPICRMC